MEEKLGKISTITKPQKDEKKKSFWHINKETLPFKIHFFLFIGGMGAVLPYQSVLGITKLGLTAGNLAAAFTAQQFLFLFLKPAIGYVADYFNRLKATIVGLTILQALFYFFMILIPSVDIQKTETSQSNNSNNYCHLCNHTEEFKNISLNQPLTGDIHTQVLDCFKYFEMYGNKHDLIHCPIENSSFHSMNISYLILEITCDDSLSRNYSSPKNYTTHHSFYSGDILFITQSFDSLENSPIVCLPPKGQIMFRDNFSFSRMKQHCHTVSNSQTADLQDLLTSALYDTTNCQNYETNIPKHEQKYDQNASLSAANFKTYQFWTFTLCMILACISASCVFTMSDTACYESLQGADYGKQRAWGAISWGLTAPFAGFLNDYTGDYMASWLLMMIFCSLQIWNLSKMDLVKPDFSQNILKDIKAVFSSIEFLAFEAGVLLNGMCTGIIWFYLMWFLTTIGGNKLVVGLAHTVQCFLGEVPFMFVSGWMIKKFGHFNLVSLALLFHAIRFFIYSYLHNPWFVLPIECVHGFTFGSFYSAMTSYGKLNSKPGIEATTQSVLCTTYEALGAGLGGLISGICFDYYGSHTTFFYASFAAAAATVFNVVCTVLIGCRQRNINITKMVVSDNGRY